VLIYSPDYQRSLVPPHSFSDRHLSRGYVFLALMIQNKLPIQG